MRTIKLLFVAISFMLAAGICAAGDSLEAKLAKLDAKIKTTQSIAKSSKTETVDKQVSRRKSLDERIAALQARQDKFSKTGAGRDVKLSSLDSKLAALKAKMHAQREDYSKSVSETNDRFSTFESKLSSIDTRVEYLQNDDALTNRIALLEQKIATIEGQEAVIQVKNDSQADDRDVLSKSQEPTPVMQVQNDSQINDNDVVSELELNAESLEPVGRVYRYETIPVAANFLSTTGVDPPESIWTRESPTNGFWGLNDKLADHGIELGLGLTSLYQANVRGGTSTHDRNGRNTSRYDFEASFDLEKLLGINGWTFFMHGWGGWPNAEGIDGVGDTLGVNALTIGNRTFDIVDCFFEGPFLADNLTMIIGKVDMGGIFDASEYADDEAGQFLNGSFTASATIPFPAQGLGVVLTWDITDSWYLMGGVSDAQGDARETGFQTALHKEDYFFYALETGVAHDDGNYRFGMWVDGQDKARLTTAKNYRDDIGFYTSCDRMLYKENGDPEDSQGLGGFFRYGWASSKYNSMTNFVSGGFQYQGLFEGRDDDVLGLGYSRGSFSSDDSANFPSTYESVIEAYYNAQITPWLALGPSIQYVSSPSDGEGGVAKDAVVVGLRAAMTF